METILLLRQCPSSIVENYALAVRNKNAVLFENKCLSNPQCHCHSPTPVTLPHSNTVLLDS